MVEEDVDQPPVIEHPEAARRVRVGVKLESGAHRRDVSLRMFLAELAKVSPRAAAEILPRLDRKEELALNELTVDQPRTLGITAISAASLFYKGRDLAQAERVAISFMRSHNVPSFAVRALRDLIQAVWTEAAMKDAGMSFLP